MVKKICSPGTKWDNLINKCLSNKTETGVETEPSTMPSLQSVVNQVRDPAPAPPTDSVTALSPALWISVMLATVGSILVLVLWFIIYRRQTRPSSTPDAEPGREPPQKTEPPASGHLLPPEKPCPTEMFQRAEEAPSPCAHLHLGTQTDSQWEEGFITCRGSAKHAGKEEDRGLMTRGHRIPLPATELGGTALVTTKTV